MVRPFRDAGASLRAHGLMVRPFRDAGASLRAHGAVKVTFTEKLAAV